MPENGQNTEDVYAGIEFKQGTPEVKKLLDFLNNGTTEAAGDNIATAIPADQKALASFGVTVLPASKALDTNVFAVTKATAKKYHLTTISSLKPYAKKLVLGGPPECPTVRSPLFPMSRMPSRDTCSPAAD